MEQFERYDPQYPLPDDLKVMDRSETICNYCGVSYLIHNEIKKLEEEIIVLKKRLEVCDNPEKKFAEYENRILNIENERDVLNESLCELRQVNSQIEKWKTDITMELDELNLINDQSKKEVEELRCYITSKQLEEAQIINEFGSNFKNFVNYHLNIKKELEENLDQLMKEQALLKEEFTSNGDELDLLETENKRLLTELREAAKDVLEERNKTTYLHKNFGNNYEKLQTEFTIQNEQLEGQTVKNHELRNELRDIQMKHDEINEKNQELKFNLEDREKEYFNLCQLNERLIEEKSRLTITQKEEISKVRRELKDAHSKNQNNNANNMRRRMDEMNIKLDEYQRMLNDRDKELEIEREKNREILLRINDMSKEMDDKMNNLKTTLDESKKMQMKEMRKNFDNSLNKKHQFIRELQSKIGVLQKSSEHDLRVEEVKFNKKQMELERQEVTNNMLKQHMSTVEEELENYQKMFGDQSKKVETYEKLIKQQCEERDNLQKMFDNNRSIILGSKNITVQSQRECLETMSNDDISLSKVSNQLSPTKTVRKKEIQMEKNTARRTSVISENNVGRTENKLIPIRSKNKSLSFENKRNVFPTKSSSKQSNNVISLYKKLKMQQTNDLSSKSFLNNHQKNSPTSLPTMTSTNSSLKGRNSRNNEYYSTNISSIDTSSTNKSSSTDSTSSPTENSTNNHNRINSLNRNRLNGLLNGRSENLRSS
ncbi:hypothetical protein SNEBB_007538 [Seison nebaliae]|nr:hypothetical protein SNEBB_007538 [Seison nebaliae]